jgi:hypothetical protein
LLSAESFSFAVLSTAKERYYSSLCDLRASSEAGGVFSFNYPHSVVWTIRIAEVLTGYQNSTHHHSISLAERDEQAN